MNKYHFTLSIQFDKDYPVSELKNILNLEPTSITPFNQSLGSKKSAKFTLTTKTLTNIYTDEMFEKFLLSIKDNLKQLPEILEKNQGYCSFRIVFEEFDEKPCISLNYETIKILSDLHANYDVDFYL